MTTPQLRHRPPRPPPSIPPPSFLMRTCGQRLSERGHGEQAGWGGRYFLLSHLSAFLIRLWLAPIMYLRLFSCSKGRGAERKWARGARWWRIRPLPRSAFHTINLPLLTVVSRKWLWRLNCIWGSFSTLCVFYLKGWLVKLWKCRLAAYPLRHLNLWGDVWSGIDSHSMSFNI